MLQTNDIKPYLKPKKVLGYMFMPRVIPRIKELVGSGFGWIAMLMAIIYQSVRLLPPNHPYLNPLNKGKFGIRHVIAEAANHLELKKENIDQIAIFFALLAGFLLLALQIGLLLFNLIVHPAFAGIPGFLGLFATPNPTDDIAFMILDQVFGIPDLYNSKFAPTIGAIPPFQQGLQILFRYYSLMLLIVAVFILLYYIVVTLGETATTGVPFGRRFNSIYAPLRLVIAVGLLVPMNYGLNAAQYITLFAAKYGSSFATNGWILFANNVANPSSYQDESLLARPTVPDTKHIVKFMMIVETCRRAYQEMYDGSETLGGGRDITIRPYYVSHSSPAFQITGAPNWQDAIDYYDRQDIIIRFGHEDTDDYPREKSNVYPYCGEITLHVTSDDGQDGVTTGAEYLQERFLRMIWAMWTAAEMHDFGRRAAWKSLPIESMPDPCSVTFPEESGCVTEDALLPPEEFKVSTYDFFNNFFLSAVEDAYDYSTNGFLAPDYPVPPALLDRGWGGAAIWYNHIAEWNGNFTAAALNVPTPSKMPSVMEKASKERDANDQTVDPENRYRPYLSDGQPVQFEVDGELPIATVLNEVYQYWWKSDSSEWTDMQESGNIIIATLTRIFGLNGLFDLRDNPDTHPLAQLVAAGKAIIESAIRNLMVGLSFSAAGGLAGAFNGQIGGFISAASGMLVTFSTVGITVGFILYYILPFIPFMYFFFAVGGWVKSIFEAMIGVPLWALAHLRIDGNGIPADNASAGYFLIFEIFVRPILTVFGLLGGMAIFTAMMRVMHDIFPLVVANLTGFDANLDSVSGTVLGIEYKRDIIDEFMFTIIYTIVAYMIATSSFKMIDQVPNTITRWMGAGIQSFNDNRDDVVPGLIQYAGIGGYSMASQVTGALEAGATGAGRAVGTIGKSGFDAIIGRNAGRAAGK